MEEVRSAWRGGCSWLVRGGTTDGYRRRQVADRAGLLRRLDRPASAMKAPPERTHLTSVHLAPGAIKRGLLAVKTSILTQRPTR
jgi:hypothetical protein